jgi:predicted RNase H-like nuclease (RuvC/YqgF family)
MKILSRLLPLVAVLFLAGCETFYQNSRYADESRREAVRVEMARQQQLREVDMLKAKVESSDLHLQQLYTRIDRLEAAQREAGNTAAETAALRRDIDQLRAERESLKREVVDELSREMAKLLAAQSAAAAPRGGSSRGSSSRQSGWEHKVQPGQTLSQIAVEYKVPVARIKEANDLKSDVIRVGQVLFIPD